MGQPVSKAGTTAPFENYQVYTGQAVAMPGGAGARGPGLPPSGMYINNDFAAPSQIGYSGPVQPTRQEMYRAQRGDLFPQERPRRGGYNFPPSGGNGMDDMNFFEDDMMSDMGGGRSQLGYDPLAGNPRFNPQRGMAGEMIDDIRQQTRQRMVPTKAQNYRSRPPQQQQPPSEPNIRRYRTVVNEPPGYLPPTQGGQGYTSQQPVVQQVAQPQQSSSTPQQITLYYDPQTGAIQNPNQTSTTNSQYGVQQAAAQQQQQPVYLSYQQPAAASPSLAYQPPAPAAPCYQQAMPMAGYQQAAPVAYQQAAAGYQQPTMAYQMPQGYMMPQFAMPQQQQPIVIPAQVISK